MPNEITFKIYFKKYWPSAYWGCVMRLRKRYRSYDDYIQKDLTSVEFYFRHINTFPHEIESKIRFLSDGNREQFAVNYTIKPGINGNPVTTEQFEFIEENRIHLVRRTIKMVVELEVQPGSAKFEGELDFASKGLFSFEF